MTSATAALRFGPPARARVRRRRGRDPSEPDRERADPGAEQGGEEPLGGPGGAGAAASAPASGQGQVADDRAVLALDADQVEAGLQQQAAQGPGAVGAGAAVLATDDPVEATAPVAVVGPR